MPLSSLVGRGAQAACLLGLLIHAAESTADTQGLAWSGELYGGRYYDDSRAGLYLASSSRLHSGATLIGEALHEQYADYQFSGIGAHFLWPVGDFGDLGLVASQAWEKYEFVQGIQTDYQTRILGAEWELERGPLVVAIQAGQYLESYGDGRPGYLSGDLYLWSEQQDWYLRGELRRVSGQSAYLIEGYRLFSANGRAVTAYAGISSDDLADLPSGSRDSIYTGAYAELFSTRHATLSLWLEAAREDGDTLLTIELNLAFGPGARTPYITAFGFSLDD